MPLWLYWIILGFVAGSLAKFLMPGRDPAGCLFTVSLGIIGALVGGLAGTYLGWGHIGQGELDVRSVAIATAGAMILLIAGKLARKL